MVEVKEKAVVSEEKGKDFEKFLSAQMVNGNLSLKKGKFNTFVEISKIVRWEDQKGIWANIRIEKQDILVLKKFLDESVVYLNANVEDPFGFDALQAQMDGLKGK